MNAQNLQSSVECAGQLEPLVKDRNHEVGAHRDPDLVLHRIGGCAVVVLDPEVALDPAEEQFDAPAQLVEHRYGESRHLTRRKSIGKSSLDFWIVGLPM